ncbi:hypothetical protein MNR02_21825 (plasmid) [Shinella sp. H4-D48]|uniref:hypothetical protein n=1 Tax=Shinella sp. H4-D48 TaxID=2925841 RepID=UPI001F534480|nr:hypothetical protein [Shinella sp. H4-D48]UNK40961.1 hypothetical protein MNR02_21825 [Shinella sp. H4-D48]
MSAFRLDQIEVNDAGLTAALTDARRPTSEIEVRRTVAQAARDLENRIAAPVNLPLAFIIHMALETKVRRIGAIEGSTSPQGKSV